MSANSHIQPQEKYVIDLADAVETARRISHDRGGTSLLVFSVHGKVPIVIGSEWLSDDLVTPIEGFAKDCRICKRWEAEVAGRKAQLATAPLQYFSADGM